MGWSFKYFHLLNICFEEIFKITTKENPGKSSRPNKAAGLLDDPWIKDLPDPKGHRLSRCKDFLGKNIENMFLQKKTPPSSSSFLYIWNQRSIVTREKKLAWEPKVPNR